MIFPRYEMFLKQFLINFSLFFSPVYSSFGFSWVPCSTGAELNIKNYSVTIIPPPSPRDYGFGAGTTLYKYPTCVPHNCILTQAAKYGVPLGSQALKFSPLLCSSWPRILKHFYRLRRGRIWKLDNNYSHPYLFLIWGHKDIHRDLCYCSQTSLCLDSKSACISHCFLKDLERLSFISGWPAERTKEKVLKYIFCLLFYGGFYRNSGDFFNVTLGSFYSSGQYRTLS